MAKMCEVSVADGFMEVSRSVSEMIKYVANEPSLGLYFVQQHAQTAIPNLVRSQGKLSEMAREVAYETEDLEDSLSMIKSMKEHGIFIADKMAGDIQKAILVMSAHHPRKRSSLSMPKAQSNEGSFRGSQGASKYSPMPSSSAKQKASISGWFPLGISSSTSSAVVKLPPDYTQCKNDILDYANTEAEELPLSSAHVDDPTHHLVEMLEIHKQFNTEQKAKLEQWLEDNS